MRTRTKSAFRPFRHHRLPFIAPVRPRRDPQGPARPDGPALHVVPDPLPPDAQVPADPAGPPLVLVPLSEVPRCR